MRGHLGGAFDRSVVNGDGTAGVVSGAAPMYAFDDVLSYCQDDKDPKTMHVHEAGDDYVAALGTMYMNQASRQPLGPRLAPECSQT